MSSTKLTEGDEGKRVVSTDGDNVGVIAEIRDGTAHVEPNPDVFDSIKSKLNWGEADGDTYPLTADQIGEVTDSEVRLQ